MNFSHRQADCFIPDSLEMEPALARTTHLGIGAHQDDLEFMALHGILECFQREDRWFGGVTCTDGAGSSRSGPYADYTDDEMKSVRVKEQKTAAVIGQYAFIAQLAHPSAVAKEAKQRGAMVDDLEAILRVTRPAVVYTHNPFDKHISHVGVLRAVLEAIEHLPKSLRPAQLYGCEVWRGLDWLPSELKVIQCLDTHPNLAASLNGVFDSQITGGKRYDLAVEGRRLANATFLDSHSVDHAQRVAYAVDLTELLGSGVAAMPAFMEQVMDRFRASILG